MTVSAGNSVSLLCSVVGSQTSGTWYHNNVGLTVNDNVLTDPSKYGVQVEDRGNVVFYILEIRSVGDEDQGHYLCRSGSDDDRVILAVTGLYGHHIHTTCECCMHTTWVSHTNVTCMFT